jgi:hypothetical protein
VNSLVCRHRQGDQGILSYADTDRVTKEGTETETETETETLKKRGGGGIEGETETETETERREREKRKREREKEKEREAALNFHGSIPFEPRYPQIKGPSSTKEPCEITAHSS